MIAINEIYGSFRVVEMFDDEDTIVIQCVNCEAEKDYSLNRFEGAYRVLKCMNCYGKTRRVKKTKDISYFEENMRQHGMSQEELDDLMEVAANANNMSTGIKNISYYTPNGGGRYVWSVAVTRGGYVGRVSIYDSPTALAEAKQVKRQMLASASSAEEGEDWRMHAWIMGDDETTKRNHQ